MKICVLQPDYSTTDVDYKHYDPPRDLARLLPGHQVDHVFLNKLTTYRQLKALAKQGYDIFVNLCEGYLEWEIPSIDVIDTLERMGLPFTGPSSTLYHPSKSLMKYVAYTVGVRTPPHVLVHGHESMEEIAKATASLRHPLFVKPAHAGDSLGIDEHSLVHDDGELAAKVREIVDEYGETLVEEYIDGREFTVLVVGSPGEGAPPSALTPVEYLFSDGPHFKTYANKTSELHPDANVPLREEPLASRLKDAAIRIFEAFGAQSYARLDFRIDADGNVYFLDINFACSVFYADGYEGSADYVLKYDGLGQAGFAQAIIAEGIARHKRGQRPYQMRGNAVAGYGIFAVRPIAAGERVFHGETRSHRIVTARHASTWGEEMQLLFRRYAYPLSEEVFVMWAADPTEWAPQNHSCAPNCQFEGLDVYAIRDIARDEELTLDYSTFLSEDAEPFECRCGAPNCRGTVRGIEGQSLTTRERARAGE